MNQLLVPFIENYNSNSPIAEISNLLRHGDYTPINITPWPAHPYRPDVSFTVMHCNDAILLKYSVNENYTQARFHGINDPVYNDSCVEFFIGFDHLPYYYNLEFNCLGTALIGYGKDRHRELLSKDIIGKVRSYSTLQSGFSEGPCQWKLTVVIPFDIFCYNNISTLAGRKAHANFFKCGEQLPQRHYCVWNHIDSPKPDFHLPEYFGSVIFV